MSGSGGDVPGAVFDSAERHFAQLTGFLSGPEAAGMEHQELEEHLLASLRETGRRLYQGHLELRAAREGRLPEVGTVAAFPDSTTLLSMGPGLRPAG